jgi:hypothetical protein
MDTQLLKDRIKETKKEIDFYTNGVEMLIEKYHINNYLSFIDYKKKYVNLDEEFLLSISKNEVPTEEVMNRLDLEEVDTFLVDCICLVGMIIGTRWLDEQEEDASEYIEMLMEFQKDVRCYIQVVGFSALTLSMERPPSGTMLERMFPLTDNHEMNSISGDILCELHADLIFKFKREKPFLKVTRTD